MAAVAENAEWTEVPGDGETRKGVYDPEDEAYEESEDWPNVNYSTNSTAQQYNDQVGVAYIYYQAYHWRRVRVFMCFSTCGK